MFGLGGCGQGIREKKGCEIRPPARSQVGNASCPTSVQAEVARAHHPGGMSRTYLPDALAAAGLPVKKSGSNFVPLHDLAALEKATAFVAENGGVR